MFDVSNLLQSFASGDTDAGMSQLLKRSKSGPPTAQLLPSQEAVSDLKAGAEEAIAMDATPTGDYSYKTGQTGSDILNDPSVLKTGPSGMDKTKLFAKNFTSGGQEAPQAQVSQVQMYGNAPREAAIQSTLPQFKLGGFLPNDELGIVGDDGPEIIKPTPDGVEIIPDEQKQQLLGHVGTSEGAGGLSTGMPNGVDQTEEAPPALHTERISPSQRAGFALDTDIAETQQQLDATLKKQASLKPSKWKDFAAALIQVGANPNAPVRSYSEIRNSRELKPIQQRLDLLTGQRDSNQQSAYRKAQIADTMAKPTDRDAERARKQNHDDRTYEIQTKTFDWKKEDRDRYFELEDIKEKAREKKDSQAYDMADKKQKELERHNVVTEKQAATNEIGRNKRTQTTVGAAMQRQQISVAAAKELKALKSANARGNADEAAKHQAELVKLKAQYDQLGVDDKGNVRPPK